MQKKRVPLSLSASLLRLVAIPAGIMLLVLAGIIFFSGQQVYNDVKKEQSLLVMGIARQARQYFNETALLIKNTGSIIAGDLMEGQSHFLRHIHKNYPRFTTLYLLDETGKELKPVAR